MDRLAREHSYLGIDVGTGSVRAAVFDGGGRLLAAAAHELRTWRPRTDFVEQSSDDIWRALCAAVREAIARADIVPAAIRGIGFDATCSLVALDAADKPVSLSPSGCDEQNVIVWMDHRALAQQARINATRHDVLRFVGGGVSVEMQTPKLLWIRENLPQSWRRTARFFDLPDFLTYRATGDDTRSLCSTVCKWTYQAGPSDDPSAAATGGWNDAYFRQIGLGDLADEGYRRIGVRVRPMGEPLGRGLSHAAAAELGLAPGTPVGVSIIDAHAGGVGSIGAALDAAPPSPADFERRLALIGGTSSCHMAVSREPRFIPGVWGPYHSAMVPGLWLTEGGQSATGALIDHVIFSHARAAELQQQAGEQGVSIYDLLNQRLDALAAKLAFPAALTRDLHVLPYFHGNRSPRADASLRGMLSGLTLGDTLDDLARLYLATIQAVAHGTRHIVDTLNAHGFAIDTLMACGGGTKNRVFLREHADATGCRIVLPRQPEAVLLGAAILGAVASGDFASIPAAMAAMSHAGDVIEPGPGPVRSFHARKHQVFLRMYEDQMAYRRLME